MAKVIPFNGATILPIPPDKILEEAKGELSEVIVVGWEKETGELYIASSTARLPDANWLLEQAKHWLILKSCEEEE